MLVFGQNFEPQAPDGRIYLAELMQNHVGKILRHIIAQKIGGDGNYSDAILHFVKLQWVDPVFVTVFAYSPLHRLLKLSPLFMRHYFTSQIRFDHLPANRQTYPTRKIMFARYFQIL